MLAFSEEDQTLPLQRQALQAAGCGQVYEERARGQTTRRPQREACLQALRAGDTLVVWRLDRLGRLGRSLSDLIRLSAGLQARGIHLESLSEGLRTGSPAGQGLWRVFGLLADFERHLSRERAAVALKALRACGPLDGRPRKLQPEALQAVRALRAAGQVPMRAIAARFGVAPSTLYRNLAEPPLPEPS